MVRERSIILSKPVKPTPKKRTAVNTQLKEAKTELKAAKAEAAANKKSVTEAMKAFLDSTSPDDAKAYRGAVSAHITAAKALAKAMQKVDKLSA